MNDSRILEGSSLRVQIASDLHLEFYKGTLPKVLELLTPSAPVLALLGDISVLGSKEDMKRYTIFLHRCCEHFERVLVLLGNHEYYSNSAEKATDVDVKARMRTICDSHPSGKLIFLENEGVDISGVRVLGATLWSYVPECMTVEGSLKQGGNPFKTVEYMMTDYHRCYVYAEELAGQKEQKETKQENNVKEQNTKEEQNTEEKKNMKDERKEKPLDCANTNKWHKASVSWLQKEIVKATDEQKNVLVLTHHTPSFRGTSSPQHEANPMGMSCGFSSDLEYLMGSRRKVRRAKGQTKSEYLPQYASLHTWCYGHTHYNNDQRIGSVRLVCNQRGYKGHLTDGYSFSKVVEVPSAWVPPPARPEDRACILL